jgi:hypothetical protein
LAIAIKRVKVLKTLKSLLSLEIQGERAFFS